MWIPVSSGLVAGLAHAAGGPDHLAAVAPFAVEGKRRAWRIGLSWGLGHALGTLVVGAAAVLLRGVLPIEVLSSATERIVGLVLVVIGVWGLHRALRRRVHVHEHEHDGVRHAHVHHHAESEPAVHHAQRGHRHTHAAFPVGVLHGVAGGSHLLGVIPALAFPTALQSAVYLVAYGLGSIAAMVAFAHVVGIVSRNRNSRRRFDQRALMALASASALCVGVFWITARGL